MKKQVLFILLFLLFFESGFSQFSNGIFKCDNERFKLLKEVSESPASRGEILLSITTHQDLGWVDEVEKCIILRDTLWLTPFLKRLKEEPGFKMDIEQTSIIMEYLNRHPEKKAEIQKGLDEGRILIGATYTQPYEEMFSGESLIRQLYLGKKWLSDHFNGYNSDTYYNSDVPGRTLQMPQILAKSDVKNMFVSRHGKGVYNWFSPDSSKVIIFSSGHYIEFYSILAKENKVAISEMVKEVLFWADYYNQNSQKVVIPALLNYEFIWEQKPVQNCDPFINLWNSITSIENENGERVNVSLPLFKYSNMNSTINAINENSSKIKDISGDRPNVWIYIHGPSHHYAISASREADILLPDAEKFAAINGVIEGNFRHYDAAKFNEAWQAKIYPDHGWGGKGGEITDRLFLSKLVKAKDDASALLSDALQRIASKIEFKGTTVPLVVFNGQNWKRNDPVSFECTFNKGEAFGINLLDQSNKLVDNQLSQLQYFDDYSLKSCKVSFVATEVPSIGYNTFYVEAAKRKSEKKIPAFDPNFENSFYSIRFGKGGIEKLFDKTLGKDVVDDSKFKLGEVFTMRSFGQDAGDFSDVQQPSMEGFDKTGNYVTSWEKTADGKVFTSFKFRQPLGYAVIEETIIVYHQIKRIDFEIDLKNWQGVLYREFRVAFPLNISSPKISYEVPMGIVEIGKDELKGIVGNVYNTECKFIHPRSMLDWVNASGSEFGATISSSVIGFDFLDPTPSPASSTLIQPILMASRKSCHGEGNDYIQLGDHHFSFSLFTAKPGWENGFHEGKQAQNGLYTVLDPIQAKSRPLKESQSFISTTGNIPLITAIKKCDDDSSLIIRIAEIEGKRQQVDVEFFTPSKSISKTNIIEQDSKTTSQNGKVFHLDLGRNSIETFKVNFK